MNLGPTLALLRLMEWSASITGAQARLHEEPPTFGACRVCNGVEPHGLPEESVLAWPDAKNYFPPDRLGHQEGCALKVEIMRIEKWLADE